MANHIQETMGSPHFTYDVTCLGADGKVKWKETRTNLVTTVGKTDIIDKYFKGSAYTAGWFMFLKGAGTVAVGDTLASHSAWAEITPYAGTRPAITFGTTANGSNTAQVVSFTINAGATIVGAGVCSAASGTSGILYSASDFSASRTLAATDTLNITLTVSCN